jgi:phage/plasmid-associated DNA primase
MMPIAGNHPPHFDEKNDAMERRIIALHLTRTFNEGERIEDIAQRIINEEFSLLVGFAIWGAHEISEYGKFTIPENIKASSTEMVAAGSPLLNFWNLLEFGPYEIATAELYTVYVRWCRDEGLGKAEPKKNLLNELARLASKTKHILKLGRSQCYQPSEWMTGSMKEPVIPSLKGVKRPEVLQGIRVKHDASGLCVGQELPTNARVASLFSS